ncbi:MAG: HEAT repeat domain-containing protein [Pseudomonadota bacterium]
MIANHSPGAAADDPVGVIAQHLRGGDDVTRCAAARALGALGATEAAPVLVEALLDEDPDVRADAMGALVTCARPGDAATIRLSLCGDPVREVKVAAIQALAALGDRESIPMLITLVEGRAEDQVAWEDDLGVWDDWLDVQVAAIEALATLDARAAIDTLLRARADEMGQELDPVVFPALAAIGDGGLSALMGFVRDPNPKTRERAIAAIARAAPDRLRPLLGLLMADDSAEVRCLAIRALEPGEREASDLALRDPSPLVRRAALEAFAPARTEIALAALGDEDEGCVALALNALPTDHEDDHDGTLAANATAWAATAGPGLATAAIRRLALLQDAAAIPALVGHSADADRPLESRLAALQAVAHLGGTPAAQALNAALTDRSRQIRVTALAGLVDLALSDDAGAASQARDAVVVAMTASAAPTENLPPQTPPSTGEATRRIRTTDAGEIVFEAIDPTTPAPGAGPSSTLEALDWGEGSAVPISTPAVDAEATEDEDALHGGDAAVRAPKAGGKRRVAVDGPDDVASDLYLQALRQGARIPHENIVVALEAACRSGDHHLRRTAFEGLATQAEVAPLPLSARQLLAAAIADRDAVIATAAARAALTQDDEILRSALVAQTTHSDATMRGLALRALGHADPQHLAAAAGADPVKATRDLAMGLLLETGDNPALFQAMEACFQQAHADTLRLACKVSPLAASHLWETLNRPGLPLSVLRTALNAVAPEQTPTLAV